MTLEIRKTFNFLFRNFRVAEFDTKPGFYAIYFCGTERQYISSIYDNVEEAIEHIIQITAPNERYDPAKIAEERTPKSYHGFTEGDTVWVYDDSPDVFDYFEGKLIKVDPDDERLPFKVAVPLLPYNGSSVSYDIWAEKVYRENPRA